tara:strand:- start:439 stop:909 length:471 start_codon:yes stop_codon:yes gene_type:complete
MKEATEFVYLFKAEHYPFIKIGYSKDPDKRLKNIRQNTPFNIIKWATMEGSRKAEKDIKNVFWNELVCGKGPGWETESGMLGNLRGEWYYIKNYYQKHPYSTVQKIREDIIYVFKNYTRKTRTGETILGTKDKFELKAYQDRNSKIFTSNKQIIFT